MAKDKKKHSKKGKVSEDVLEVAALSIKKFRKVTKQLSKLSLGQKIVGGVALLAVGLTYLASSETTPEKKSATPSPDPFPDEDAAPPAHTAVAMRKPRKSTRLK